MKYAALAFVILCVLVILSAPMQAQVSFFQPPTFPDCLPIYYTSLFVADFNGDGKSDLLCSTGSLSLGNGDYVHSPRRLRSIHSAMNPTMEIDESILQAGLVLLPRHSVHPPGAAFLFNE